METDIFDVLTKGIIDLDIERIKTAVVNNDEEGLNWVRDLLDNGHIGYSQMDVQDLFLEFRARGLKLATIKHDGTGFAGVDK